MALAVQTIGLTKRYGVLGRGGGRLAVDHLDLEVEQGVIFGFLGPNGAGKTTTIKMLLGLIFPTEGRAELLGKPVGNIQVRREISYLPESPYFYDYLSGAELLNFYGKLFNINAEERGRKIRQLLQLVGLAEDKKPLREYSKGMLQRVGIAQALINDPKLLFFDEPTSGLDPIAHIEIRDVILKLKEEGKTIFTSSHQLSDVELICDRVSIIHRGKLMKIGDVDDLLKGSEVQIIVDRPLSPALEQSLRGLSQRVVEQEGRILLYQSDEELVGQIIDAVRAERARLISVTPQRQSLESIFLQTVRDDDSGAALPPEITFTSEDTPLKGAEG
ncbi:MAG: ABC transporter ATP-binding protein [Armatimonadetes bacterium]|nr:ABC transporter ATP-binding protein [Armatimonadota bacterium]